MNPGWRSLRCRPDGFSFAPPSEMAGFLKKQNSQIKSILYGGSVKPGNINSYLGLAATYDAMDSLSQAEAALQQAIIGFVFSVGPHGSVTSRLEAGKLFLGCDGLSVTAPVKPGSKPSWARSRPAS